MLLKKIDLRVFFSFGSLTLAKILYMLPQNQVNQHLGS